jgi:pimeloyl-ACP methyl ester carboxylesterase
LLNNFSTPALRSVLAAAVAGVSRRALLARLRAILSVNFSSELKAVVVPIIYLRASRDRLVPSTAANLISDLCPTVEVVSIEAPHLLLQAVPDEAAQAVAVFLRKIGNNGH